MMQHFFSCDSASFVEVSLPSRVAEVRAQTIQWLDAVPGLRYDCMWLVIFQPHAAAALAHFIVFQHRSTQTSFNNSSASLCMHMNLRVLIVIEYIPVSTIVVWVGRSCHSLAGQTLTKKTEESMVNCPCANCSATH